jgi:hypothetical protein
MEEGWHDDAAWACATLELELRLPIVHQPGPEDRRVHDAWRSLSTVPAAIRDGYLAAHGIPLAAWLAWEVVERVKGKDLTGMNNVVSH